jgi:hypothetical protein
MRPALEHQLKLTKLKALTHPPNQLDEKCQDSSGNPSVRTCQFLEMDRTGACALVIYQSLAHNLSVTFQPPPVDVLVATTH